MQKYNQIKAMLAITKASLRGQFRSPSAVLFSFAFPFIFILVFGFIGKNTGVPVFKIALSKNCDTINALFDSIKKSSSIKIVYFPTDKELRENLVKGKLSGVLTITKNAVPQPAYRYTLSTTSASNDKWPQLLPLINGMVNTVSNQQYANRPTFAVSDFDAAKDVEVIREYKTIDFVLPGQLGFSLLSAGVFGVTAVVIIVVGRFLFGFTLIHGVFTLLEMLVLSFIGLLVFMGLGFIVSGFATSDSSIPPFANLLTLPQFLLGGTFFSVDAFPSWLQPISKALPLTHLNTAMRAVAFEGLNLWDVRAEIGILILWGIVIYAVAVKVFKWE